MTIVYDGPGDILRCDVETLTAPVNTIGVMGNGLALAFKLRYAGLFPAYVAACRRKAFDTDGLFLWEYLPERKILCFPTKRRFHNPSKIEWIEHALERLANDWEQLGIKSLAVPQLGCGKGELKWDAVRPLVYQYLDPIALEVSILIK